MNIKDKSIEVLCAVAAMLSIVGLIVLVIWLLSFPFNAIGSWWNNSIAESNKVTEAQEKEWATHPKNPKVVGQKCIDSGGFPTYSAWDGRFLECKGKEGNEKNVNIEVNQ